MKWKLKTCAFILLFFEREAKGKKNIYYPNVDHSIGSITLQRIQLQVPLKVACIQSRNGQAIPITSLDKTQLTYKTRSLHQSAAYGRGPVDVYGRFSEQEAE